MQANGTPLNRDGEHFHGQIDLNGEASPGVPHAGEIVVTDTLVGAGDDGTDAIREITTRPYFWITRQLNMGTPDAVSRYVSEFRLAGCEANTEFKSLTTKVILSFRLRSATPPMSSFRLKTALIFNEYVFENSVSPGG